MFATLAGYAKVLVAGSDSVRTGGVVHIKVGRVGPNCLEARRWHHWRLATGHMAVGDGCSPLVHCCLGTDERCLRFWTSRICRSIHIHSSFGDFFSARRCRAHDSRLLCTYTQGRILCLSFMHFENGHDVKKVADLLGRALESCEDAVGPATLIYIVSLCEDGRNDEAMKILSRLQKWHDRQVKGHEESEEANFPHWGGEPIGEANTRLVYAEKKPGTWDMAKAVWMATQGSMMSVSLEILDSVEKENPDLGMLLYLRGLFAKWRGNNDEAKRYWKRLLEHGRGDPFLKFSFVRKWVAE